MLFKKVKVFSTDAMPHKFVKQLTNEFTENLIIPYCLHSNEITKELFLNTDSEVPNGYIACQDRAEGFVSRGNDELSDWLADNGAYPYETVIIDLSGVFDSE